MMAQPAGLSSSVITRRRALIGIGAVALSQASQPIPAAQPPPFRIDVHSHLAPPAWIRKLTPEGVVLPPLANWSVARHLDDMDRGGVQIAVTSITAPGLWFSDAPALRTLARACNDYAAELRSQHPDRFGVFAVLPLPDVEGSLREMEYALDVLKADGICLYTSYDGKWLGDPAFDAVFAELNRRKTLVYTHPVAANCCRNLVPGINDATIEFGTDTTRAIARYVFSGSASRFPNVRLIFSHAGGTMPYLIERFDVWSRNAPNARELPGFRSLASGFFYDIAQSANPVALRALASIVPDSHILFGSDYPFRTTLEHVTGLANCGVFDAAAIRGIERENFLSLTSGISRHGEDERRQSRLLA
jgi:predicted TIM-barrel fold metal-dependent hydrolase